MKKKRGIKRHEALQPLSRHHMEGLHAGLKLSRAGTEESKITTEEIIQDVQHFWQPGGQEHFREEEEILLPAFAVFADINRPEITQMLLEHVTIRSMMQQLFDSELSYEAMRELGILLQKHIRTEERVIFPMIEAALPEEKLVELTPYLQD